MAAAEVMNLLKEFCVLGDMHKTRCQDFIVSIGKGPGCPVNGDGDSLTLGPS